MWEWIPWRSSMHFSSFHPHSLPHADGTRDDLRFFVWSSPLCLHYLFTRWASSVWNGRLSLVSSATWLSSRLISMLSQHWCIQPRSWSALAGAPLWTSQSSYVTQIGTINAELKGKKPETGITQFLGVFFAFFQTSKHATWSRRCYKVASRMISFLTALQVKSGEIWSATSSLVRRPNLSQSKVNRDIEHLQVSCSSDSNHTSLAFDQ